MPSRMGMSRGMKGEMVSEERDACADCGGELAGVVIRGTHDGPLYWVCGSMSCDLAMPRKFANDPKLTARSDHYVALHNEGRKVRQGAS